MSRTFKVTLELENIERIDRNIDALERASEKSSMSDSVLLLDTKSILEGIKKQVFPYRVPDDEV